MTEINMMRSLSLVPMDVSKTCAKPLVLWNRQVAEGVRVLVVPVLKGTQEAEKRDSINFEAAGAQWRFAGCSMCLAMNLIS